jgi:hypothetical protein
VALEEAAWLSASASDLFEAQLLRDVGEQLFHPGVPAEPDPQLQQPE